MLQNVFLFRILLLIFSVLILTACEKSKENVIVDSKLLNKSIKALNKAEIKQVFDNKLKVNNDTSFLLITKPQKGQTSETWSGITFPFQKKIDFKKGKVVSFRAYVYDSLKLLLELEPIIDPQIHSYVLNNNISKEQSNKWLDFHLGYSDAYIQGAPKEVFKVTFFLNFLEYLVEDKVILIDDIYIGTSDNYYQQKLNDFETPEQIYYPFGGSGCELIRDPENENNTVLRYIKPVGTRQIDLNAAFAYRFKDTSLNVAPKIKLRGLVEKPCEIIVEILANNGKDNVKIQSKRRYHSKDVHRNWKDVEFEFSEYSEALTGYKVEKLILYIDKGAALKEARSIMISPELEFVYSNNSKGTLIDVESIETIGGSIVKIVEEDNKKRKNLKLIKNTDLPLSKISTVMVNFNQPLKVDKNQKLKLHVKALFPNIAELKIELLSDTLISSTDYHKSVKIDSPDSLVQWLDIKFNYLIKEDTEFKSLLLSLDDNKVYEHPINLFINKISYSIE